DLSAIISNFYSRAGIVRLGGGGTGSVTFIGTVSPAGGNLKEPVTESTKKAARCFYALSQQRADSKRYPAIDPLDSYSKYLDYPEIESYLEDNFEKGWVARVKEAKTIVQRGKEVYEQINILGDDGVPVSYHDRYWKSELIDFCFLQQDSFDAIDSNCSLERQRYMFSLIMKICGQNFAHDDFEACTAFYKELIILILQIKYSEFGSDGFRDYESKVEKLVDERPKEKEEDDKE
ncbi:MAG: V-type ATP synthase subunit A, partial [Rikenellaceae bacterium]|nr:V-type ATP synthase subunit A [Rikenellaceae bacterium]